MTFIYLKAINTVDKTSQQNQIIKLQNFYHTLGPKNHVLIGIEKALNEYLKIKPEQTDTIKKITDNDILFGVFVYSLGHEYFNKEIPKKQFSIIERALDNIKHYKSV